MRFFPLNFWQLSLWLWHPGKGYSSPALNVSVCFVQCNAYFIRSASQLAEAWKPCKLSGIVSLLLCLFVCWVFWVVIFVGFLFFFLSFPNCSLSRKPNPGADNGGLSIAKWLHSCSQGRAVARAFMASNFLVPCRGCGGSVGTDGLQELAAGGCCAMGFPPFQRL